MQAKKKKKGKGGANEEENQKVIEENENDEKQVKTGKGNTNFDDRYYDLDDNFIDDGDLEDSCYNNGLYGMGMNANGFGDEFDGYHDMEDDEAQSSKELTNKMGSNSKINVEYDPEADQKKEDEREQKKYK